MSIQFKQWECVPIFTTYQHNQQPALRLIDFNDGQPIATATVCIDYDFEPNETAIKDYSENEGMLDTLITEGFVTDTGKRVQSGFVEIPIVALTQKALELCD
jgi:hypothetical protein